MLDLAVMATSLLAERGRPATLIRRLLDPAPNPAKPWASLSIDTPETTSAVTVVMVETKRRHVGEDVLEGEVREAWLSGEGLAEVRLSDVVKDEANREWAVRESVPIGRNDDEDEALAYRLLLER